MDISACVPKNKYDFEAIERARQKGFPALNPALPELLEWVKDANWPVAVKTADLVSTAGLQIVPHIEAILCSDDTIWKYWVIDLVVRNSGLRILRELRGELVRLAESPPQDDQAAALAEVARSVLFGAGLQS